MINLIGWTGAVVLLIAYALVSLKNHRGTSMSFQCLNIVGSTFLIVNTISKEAYPSAFVNLVWVGIALVSLTKGKGNMK